MPQNVLTMPLGYINGGISSDFFSILASLAPENLDNSKYAGMILFHYGESWNLLRADQRLIFAKSWPRLPGINRDTRIYLFCEVIFRHRYLFAISSWSGVTVAQEDRESADLGSDGQNGQDLDWGGGCRRCC